jgi:hypothetical protein
MATEQTINGNRYSFASIEAAINGRRFKAFTEINYSDSLEVGDARGTSSIALGETDGDYSTEGSFTMLRREFDQMVAELGDGYGMTRFPMTVVYANRGEPTVTDRLPAVRITGVENGHSQGNEPLTVQCTIKILVPIERNGRRLVPRDA